MDTESIAVVILAAGYGSRIAKDLSNDPQFSYLSSTPKPLLPLAGKPLLSHWLPQITAISQLSSITLITNGAHYKLYREWAGQQSDTTDIPITVLSDSTMNNDTRLGAIQDLNIALSCISRNTRVSSSTPATLAVVIAADTLLPDIEFSTDVINKFISSSSSTDKYSLGVVAYKLSDMSDCVRRGMLSVKPPDSSSNDQNLLIATGLVEKPKSIELAPSPWATAPIYFLRPNLWPLISTFLRERSTQPITTRDAPGYLLSWLLSTYSSQYPCLLLPVPVRIDIGRLFHYKHALHQFTHHQHDNGNNNCLPRLHNEPAVGRAYPRIGILGNPSDMYGGHVIATTIASEGYAEVIISPMSKSSMSGTNNNINKTFEIIKNESMEFPTSFSSASSFLSTFQSHGVRYGAYSLVIAAVSAFFNKLSPELQTNFTACTLSYSTTIPQRIGLAGSSALILATMKALARFLNTTLYQLDSKYHAWPELLRNVEREQLGIECGLMDRITQVFQGCVSMDFSSSDERWTFKQVPATYFPQLYIVYNSDNESDGGSGAAAQCSGDIHSRAKKRIKTMADPDVKGIAKQLADGAIKLTNVLSNVQSERDMYIQLEELPQWFDTNFQLRCKLLGLDNIAKANLDLIEHANELGLAAKMSGSGGCAICVPRPFRKLTEENELAIRTKFNERGMVFHKVQILDRV